jgi:effector-binding domain-containing protein
MREVKENHEVDAMLQETMQGELPAEVEVRMRRRLTEFQARLAERPRSRWEAVTGILPGARMWRWAGAAALVLIAIAVGVGPYPFNTRSNRVYAAAVEQLKGAQTLSYTLVFNEQPYAGIDFAFQAPGLVRFNCSWGIEARLDKTTGRSLVLMHALRGYVTEQKAATAGIVESEDVASQLRALPDQADERLGERRFREHTLAGYRLTKSLANGASRGVRSVDVWVDPLTREADHADITLQEPGRPAYTMHIRDIRVGGAVNAALFDLTPPAGYKALGASAGPVSGAKPSAAVSKLTARIEPVADSFAVVVPMQGSYAMASAALGTVEEYLKKRGIAPAGAPLGRFWSEQHWEAGYPVATAVKVDAPFQLVRLPGGLTATAVVKGSWGANSEARWNRFYQSIVDQGYLLAGPATEIWTGGESAPVTEMRVAVTRAK